MCVNLCAIEGCTRRLAARGWCHTHYEMWRRKGDPLAAKRFADNSGCCAIDDCDHQAYSKGLCDRHYTRLRRHGNPTAIKVRRGWSLEQRFETDIDRTATSPSCWIWRGPLDRKGYGMLYVSHNRFLRVHRYSYERFVGQIPEGWDIDHLCRITACANPAHLEAVTHAVNCLRGVGMSAQNARKTRCKHGHKFTSANTYITASGARRCRACRRKPGRDRVAGL